MASRRPTRFTEFAFARPARRCRVPLFSVVLLPGFMIGTGLSVLGTRTDVGRHLQLRNLLAEEAFDVRKAALILLIHKRDCRPGPVGTRRATDAMHIVLRIGWNIKIDDQADALDVNASGQDICSDDNRQFPALELPKNLIAFMLLKVGVKRLHGKAFALQLGSKLLHVLLR